MQQLEFTPTSEFTCHHYVSTKNVATKHQQNEIYRVVAIIRIFFAFAFEVRHLNEELLYVFVYVSPSQRRGGVNQPTGFDCLVGWLVGWLVYPSSSLGWRYGANSNPRSRHQPN